MKLKFTLPLSIFLILLLAAGATLAGQKAYEKIDWNKPIPMTERLHEIAGA